MKIKVTLLDTSTGEMKTITEEVASMSVAEALWLEGNYSCDCNRSILMHGLHIDSPLVLPCDDGVNFVIRLVSLKHA